jgi:hypothetical protein
MIYINRYIYVLYMYIHSYIGLGMMITKALVDLHRGHVSVRSDGLGLGSTFTLTLPLSCPPINDTSSSGKIELKGAQVP